MLNVAIARSDQGDWIGVYINGYLVLENHSITPELLLGVLEIPFDVYHGINLEETGRLPSSLSELTHE